MTHYKSIKPTKYDRRTHNISFKYAWNGIVIAFKTQPNFRIHSLFYFIIVVASIAFRITFLEFAVITAVSGLVVCMEMVNTVVEAVGDELAGGKYNKMVGVAKDVAAGGVLLSAITAVLVGLIIFVPRALELISIF